MKDGTFRQYLWIHSNDRDSGDDNDSKFVLKQQIENVKTFRLKKINVDTVASAYKIISNSLSNLTTDRIMTTNKNVHSVVFTDDLNQNIVYNSQNGKISSLDIKVYDELGTTLLTVGSLGYSMLIEFECFR